jgi:hypothetical protein
MNKSDWNTCAITHVTHPQHSSANARVGFIIARCVAAGFAFWATARHPYDFYILTRWVVFVTCCWGVFLCRHRLWPSIAPVYAVIGLVFNPLAPFHFARNTWHDLDIIAAVVLLVSLAFNRPPK